MRIAIDAMGGDYAPKAVIEGALRAARENRELGIILVGNQDELKKNIENGLPPNVELQHAEGKISMEDEPVMAVRRKKDSSMVQAVQMVKDKSADAVISAGNTGAFMAAGLLIVGKMKGIDRPALAPFFPRVDGGATLVLDVGANMDVKAKHLLQYAIMGKIYMEYVLKRDHPKIGLLNVGTEENKGNELTKEAFPLLQSSPLQFVGNVEARDVIRGACDVLVCDGFSGNILLKASEGAVGALTEMLKEEFTRTWPNKIAAAVLKPCLKRIKNKVDYSESGGAPLLGLQGVCIKVHGSSDPLAFVNAIKQAKTFIENDVLSLITNQINAESE